MSLVKKYAAFTLLELVVTLAITSILVSLTAPSWSRFIAERNVNLQVWELRRTLELARGLAVPQHLVWKVCIIVVRTMVSTNSMANTEVSLGFQCCR